MTKEELIGRKFMCGTFPTVYTIENADEYHQVNITWENDRGGLKYEVKFLQNKFESGQWQLIPEKSKTYTTLKGIKYGVGTTFYTKKFAAGDTSIYEIKSITVDTVTIKWNKTNSLHYYLLDRFNTTLDAWDSVTINNYQVIDPTTIKFDFTNTKIRVNSPEESEWIQKVAFNNGYKWANSPDKLRTNTISGLYFVYSTIEFADFGHDSVRHFNEHRNKEITIQDILNSNQMKEVIEVGDIVEYINPSLYDGYEYEVTKVTDIQLYFTGDWSGTKNQYKILRKANKQEIIGYELLKDLPNVKAGTVSNIYNKPFYGFDLVVKRGDTKNMSIHVDDLQDITWFKPIYKAKEVVFKISGGRAVTITSDKLSIENGAEFCNKQQLLNLRSYLNREYQLQTGRKAYAVEITTFRLGCQEFTKQDIELLYQTIRDIK